MPARNGVTAALLVQIRLERRRRHLLRARTISSWPTRRRRNPTGSIEKLGERYEIAQTDIKKWTVGSPIQAPLDAIEAIRGKHPFEADQVKKRDRAARAVGRRRRGQSRHPGHLPAAHGRRDADRQDRVVPGRARQAAHAGRRRCCKQRAKVDLVRDEELAKLPAGARGRRRDRTDRRRASCPSACRPCAGRRAIR